MIQAPEQLKNELFELTQVYGHTNNTLNVKYRPNDAIPSLSTEEIPGLGDCVYIVFLTCSAPSQCSKEFHGLRQGILSEGEDQYS